MSFEEIKEKRLKAIAKASQAIGVVTEQASEAVDAFFAEKAIKDAAYVPQKLIIKTLPVGLYQVRWEDGVGVLPDVLSGTYTSMHQAQKAIDLYLSCRNKP